MLRPSPPCRTKRRLARLHRTRHLQRRPRVEASHRRSAEAANRRSAAGAAGGHMSGKLRPLEAGSSVAAALLFVSASAAFAQQAAQPAPPQPDTTTVTEPVAKPG